jgi:hypothetical protein
VKPEEFIDTLDPERRKEFTSVYRLMAERIPPGYEQVVIRNMVVFQVPLKDYPDTYNRQPLWYAALASDKTCLSLHLMPIYGDVQASNRLKDAFAAAGKKLNAGKACIRFKRASDLELDVIADILGSIPVKRWIDVAKAARQR